MPESKLICPGVIISIASGTIDILSLVSCINLSSRLPLSICDENAVSYFRRINFLQEAQILIQIPLYSRHGFD